METKTNDIVRHNEIVPQTVENTGDNLQEFTETEDRKWSKQQLLYMVILADPFDERTEEEISKDIGVSRMTMWKWRQDEDFNAAAHDMLMKFLNGELRKVYKGLVKRAAQGEVEQAKLVFAQLDKLKENAGEVHKHAHLHKHFSDEKEEFGI